MSNPRFWACFVPSVLLFGASAAAQTYDALERSFDVSSSSTPTVYVRNEDGRTILTGRPAGRVEIRAVKEVVRASSEVEARSLADEVEVRVERMEDAIRVVTVYPQHEGWFRRDARVLVHLEISAPRGSDLDVSTEDGPLTVEGFEGRLRLASEDGGVRVADCGGDVHVDAEDGDVDLLSMRDVLRVRVEDGDLRVEGTLSGLDAESEDGDIDIRLGPGAKMTSDWTVRAQDGRVSLHLPGDFGAEIDVSVDDGSISIDHPGASTGRISDERWTATMNEGGHQLRVRAEDGSVRIRESTM